MAAYGDIADWDVTKPAGGSTGNKVSDLDDYQRETREDVQAQYDAEHTWVEVTSGTEIDLSSVGGAAIPQVKCIRFLYGGIVTITDFTNHVPGQELILLNMGAPAVTLDHNGSYMILESGVDVVLEQYDVAILKDYSGVWYLLSYSDNSA
jgi:hypothetical protein